MALGRTIRLESGRRLQRTGPHSSIASHRSTSTRRVLQRSSLSTIVSLHTTPLTDQLCSRTSMLLDVSTSLEVVAIFTDMLNNAEEGYPLGEDELVQQLYSRNRSNGGTLSQLLTRAANGEVDVDEALMMQLLEANERVLEANQYFQDIVSGKRRPAGKATPGGSAPSRSPLPTHKRQASSRPAGESKEDEEQAARSRKASSPPPAAASYPGDPYAAAAASSARSPAQQRKKSELPDALAQFDMLGLSASPDVYSSPPAQQPRVYGGGSTSPSPAGNASQALSPNRAQSSGLAAPPSSSSRRRKESSGQRSDFTLPASAHATQPTGGQRSASLFDLDMLMAANAPPAGASTSPPQHTPSNSRSPFAAAAAPSNDFFASSNPNASFPPNSTSPFAAYPSSVSNPFEAFDSAPAPKQRQQSARSPQKPTQQAAADPFNANFDDFADPFGSIASRGQK
jgi:hypothetical protein